jgi:hypothetical protein
VPLTPLTPTVSNLGYLRLCRDDLRQIVDRVRQLANVTIDLEADNHRLDDVETDLPGLGERLSYFTLKAYRRTEAVSDSVQNAQSSEGGRPVPTEVLSLHLSKSWCRLETTNPDLDTEGVISGIERITQQCRRAPKWFPRIFWQGQPQDATELWWTIAFALAIGGIIIAPVLHSTHPAQDQKQLVLSAAWAVTIGVVSGLILLFTVIGSALTRTILLTSLRADSPTWWRRNRDGFVIGIITGIATGLLTGELIYLLTKP